MRFILAVFLAAAPIGIACAAGLDDANAGLAAARRGEFDEAIRLFSAALAAGDLSPGNVMLAHHNRGNAYQDKGDYPRAIADYTTAIRMKPDYAEAFYARGRARYALGDLAASGTDFARSVRLDPSDAYAVLWLHLVRGRAAASDADELKRNAGRLDLAHWPGALVSLYLGKSTPGQVRGQSAQGDADAQREKTCEAAFFLGEYELLRMNDGAAKPLFEEAAKNCPYTTDEYDGAMLELARLL